LIELIRPQHINVVSCKKTDRQTYVRTDGQTTYGGNTAPENKLHGLLDRWCWDRTFYN